MSNSAIQEAAETPVPRHPLVSALQSFEMPTVAVAAVIYGGYGLVTWFFRDLPIWLATPVGAILLTWYGSLQHETIHNHPTPSPQLNRAFGGLPLSLWIPYRIYRATHLQHHRHRGRRLTEVSSDPESFYLRAGSFSRRGLARKCICLANCTLAGRLTLGPAVAAYRFWARELRKMLAGDRRRRVIWARHMIEAGLVLVWVALVCRIPIAVYALLVVYPSISLSHLRSFTEHRANPDASLRTVSVEAHSFWALLFLNNNLHVAHHAQQKVPWYQLPAVWKQMRPAAIERGLVFDGGYVQVLRRYLWRPVISVDHPGRPDTASR